MKRSSWAADAAHRSVHPRLGRRPRTGEGSSAHDTASRSGVLLSAGTAQHTTWTSKTSRRGLDNVFDAHPLVANPGQCVHHATVQLGFEPVLAEPAGHGDAQ